MQQKRLFGNLDIQPETPTTPSPKRRGRPKGAKDTKPRKSPAEVLPADLLEHQKVPPTPGTQTKHWKTTGKKPTPRAKVGQTAKVLAEVIIPKGKKSEKVKVNNSPTGAKAGPVRVGQGAQLVLGKEFVKAQTGDLSQPKHITQEDIAQISDKPDWAIATPEEQMFCYEYFTRGFNLISAYKAVAGEAAYGGLEEIQKRAYIYVNRARVVKALRVLVDYFLQDRKIALAPKILDVLEAQAFYDPANIIGDDGCLVKKLADLDYRDRLCIKSIETKYFGKDADVSTTVVTLVDRVASLEKLARFIALFSSGDVTNNLHVHLPEDSKNKLGAVFQAAARLRLPEVQVLEDERC